jgi:hypothetical protein
VLHHVGSALAAADRASRKASLSLIVHAMITVLYQDPQIDRTIVAAQSGDDLATVPFHGAARNPTVATTKSDVLTFNSSPDARW